MKSIMANFHIVQNTDALLLLRDLGPWDEFYTITNAAENLVKYLVREGILKPGQRLQYYDSENELTEIIIKFGKFGGFSEPTKKQSIDLPLSGYDWF